MKLAGAKRHIVKMGEARTGMYVSVTFISSPTMGTVIAVLYNNLVCRYKSWWWWWGGTENTELCTNVGK